MTALPSCPDCTHRDACIAGTRLMCLARERRAERTKRESERERLRKWNEEAKGRGK